MTCIWSGWDDPPKKPYSWDEPIVTCHGHTTSVSTGSVDKGEKRKKRTRDDDASIQRVTSTDADAGTWLSRHDDEKSSDRVMKWLNEYRPASTVDNYQRYEELFWKWVDDNGIREREKLHWPSQPIPAAVIADYLHWCVAVKDPPLAPSTMKVCSSAISNMHVMHGMEPPSHSRMLSVAKRTLVNHFSRLRGVNRRKPFTPELLRSMATYVNPSVSYDIRDWTMIVLACTFGLRGSEVCSLRKDDVWINSSCSVLTEPVIWVHLRSSKTDQAGHGHTRVAPATVPNAPWMCPRTWMQAWLLHRQDKSEYLFHQVAKECEHLPIARATLYHRIKQMTESCGVDPKGYGTHSARITFATWSGASQVEERIIKAAGGWKSDAVHVYIHETLQRMLSPAKAIQAMAADVGNGRGMDLGIVSDQKKS